APRARSDFRNSMSVEDSLWAVTRFAGLGPLLDADELAQPGLEGRRAAPGDVVAEPPTDLVRRALLRRERLVAHELERSTVSRAALPSTGSRLRSITSARFPHSVPL